MSSTCILEKNIQISDKAAWYSRAIIMDYNMFLQNITDFVKENQ